MVNFMCCHLLYNDNNGFLFLFLLLFLLDEESLRFISTVRKPGSASQQLLASSREFTARYSEHALTYVVFEENGVLYIYVTFLTCCTVKLTLVLAYWQSDVFRIELEVLAEDN